MARRANGEGSIFRLESGKWRIQVEFPTLPGQPRRRLVRHVSTKTEAVTLLQQLREEAGAVSPERMTVSALIDTWMERRGPEWAPSTIAQRTVATEKHVEPAIGSVLASDLKPVTVDAWLAGLICGPRIKQVAFDTLKMAMDYAVAIEIIGRNPCTGIPRPQCRRKDIRPFTPKEADALITKTEDDPAHAFIVLSLACGPRQAELFGLRWENVDLKARTIRIEEQATDTGGKVTVRQPKTKSGTRTIDIPKFAVTALVSHKAMLLRSGLAGVPLVFPAPMGQYMDRGRFRTRFWSPLLKRLNLDHRGAHHLRHTYATLALGAGVPVHVVSAILGHSKPSTTLDLYSHAIPSQKAEAAALMHRLLG